MLHFKMKVFSTLALVMSFAATAASFDTEIISDLVPSKAFEGRSLELKKDEFWKPVLEAAQTAEASSHFEVYEQVEAAIAALPEENHHVSQLLSKALRMLKNADEALTMHSRQTAEVATEKLSSRPKEGSVFSFLTGGSSYKNAFAKAIKTFVGAGSYAEKLENQIRRRQADILPALRDTVKISNGVLTDCRGASTSAFDVLKYDIYNKGVPKTPASAKAAADRIVDAASETRRNFMHSIISTVSGITKDAKDSQADPYTVMTKPLRTGLDNWGSVEPATAGQKYMLDL